MGIATSLYAIGDAIDPSQAYWSLLLTTGRKYDEHHLVYSNIKGQKGVRKLDCKAVLEITEDMPAFQFKTKSLDMMGAGGSGLEFQVIGRVIDKASGRCECFAWDYRPKPGEPQLVAYRSNIYNWGAFRDTVTPIGALGIEVQGWRL